jgi:hypothetical protein
LAGTSAGKTVPAHRRQFLRLFGALTEQDQEHLRAFVAARAEHANREGARVSDLLGIFCRAARIDDALATARPQLTPSTWNGLAKALAHFRPRFDVVWDDGAVAKAFLERARRDPGRIKLEALLTKLVRFYDVDPLSVAPPRLALVPVPAGFGTHAEAIGDVLLLEIRSGEGLADEASVVVHENAHFLWSLVPGRPTAKPVPGRRDEGEAAEKIFRVLGRRFPRCSAKGIADRSFNPSSWSLDDPWYHVEDVDACAKRIYPVLETALELGQKLDEDLVRRVLRTAKGPP